MTRGVIGLSSKTRDVVDVVRHPVPSNRCWTVQARVRKPLVASGPGGKAARPILGHESRSMRRTYMARAIVDRHKQLRATPIDTNRPELRHSTRLSSVDSLDLCFGVAAILINDYPFIKPLRLSLLTSSTPPPRPSSESTSSSSSSRPPGRSSWTSR